MSPLQCVQYEGVQSCHLCRKELWFLPGCLCAWLLLVLLKVLRELNLLPSTWMEQLGSLFLVLNNCAFLWKDLLCLVAHGHVFGSSLGCIHMIIHWGEKNLGSLFWGSSIWRTITFNTDSPIASTSACMKLEKPSLFSLKCSDKVGLVKRWTNDTWASEYWEKGLSFSNSLRFDELMILKLKFSRDRYPHCVWV